MEIEISEALTRSDVLFVDVRSPVEYEAASIPGAVNIPLFDDREHRRVSIIYHQMGESEARRAALEIVAPKLPALVDKIVKASCKKIPLLYCRKGGLRSLSLYEVLKLTGIQTLRLKKGYKAYRNFINRKIASYELKSKLFVLHGLTGVGKTIIINKLGEKGLPVLDLEGLAGHRGSAFGAVGINSRRSQKDFDALLMQELDRLGSEPYFFIEGEGRRIGNIYLPPFLGEAMDKGFQILLTASVKTRVDRIVETYIPEPLPDRLISELKVALNSLEKRLGCKKTEHLLAMLESGDYRGFAEIMCTDYYDLFYSDSRPECSSFEAVIDVENIDSAVEEIIELAQKTGPAGSRPARTI